MPGGRSHRPKFKLKSIHVDELLSAAGMSGYLSVLEPPAEAPAHLERLAGEMLEEYRNRGETVPERYQETAGINKIGIPETGTPATGTPKARVAKPRRVVRIAAPDVEKGIPEIGIPIHSLPLERGHTIRQATLVQDGHSLGEQAVYQTLWDHAQPYDSESRLIGIGYRTLSSLCRLTVNNCKANLIALCRKLALKELSGHGPTQSKTYRVFSYNAILRRRRQAGLTHYIKTRGVAFVDPSTGQEIFLAGIPETGIPLSEKGIPESDSSGIPVSAPPSLEQLNRQSPPPSVSSSSLPYQSIRTALEQTIGPVDDDAVVRLVYACLSRAPGIEDEEIAAMVRLKGARMRSEKIQNPVGYLLTAVPRVLEGGGLERFRAWRSPANEQAIQIPNDLKADLRRLAEDPLSTAEDRAFALRVLTQLDQS